MNLLKLYLAVAAILIGAALLIALFFGVFGVDLVAAALGIALLAPGLTFFWKKSGLSLPFKSKY